MKFHKLTRNGADDTAKEKTAQMIVAVTVGCAASREPYHGCGTPGAGVRVMTGAYLRAGG